MVVGFSRKFLSKEVDFIFTFKELMFLSDSFSLVKDDDTDIPILGGTPLFSKASETYRSDGIPVNSNIWKNLLCHIKTDLKLHVLRYSAYSGTSAIHK